MKFFSTIAILAIATISSFATTVVASTSWTAAFALAAGAEDVTVLAPAELTHPPEYELRPSDLLKIGKADVVVYAGYENMVPRLLDAANNGGAEAIQIETVHTRQQIAASIRAIADVLGTTAVAERNIARINDYLDDWATELSDAGIAGLPVVVHMHQQALARAIGLNVVGTFGPAPLEARQIDELSKLSPALIIDNGHNPIAGPLAETTGAQVAVWYNFPGAQGSRTLLDVFAVNRKALEEATVSR